MHNFCIEYILNAKMQHTKFIPRITLFKSTKQADIFCHTTVNLKYVKRRE